MMPDELKTRREGLEARIEKMLASRPSQKELKTRIDKAVQRLTNELRCPKPPKWRFDIDGEELDEWYDRDNKTLVISRQTDADMSGVAHEYVHYLIHRHCEDPERFMDEGLADAVMDTLADIARRQE